MPGLPWSPLEDRRATVAAVRLALSDGARLFVDVDGAGLRPDGPAMRSVPTLILLHGGPGFDHSPFKAFFRHLVDGLQLVYYDHRGMGRSDVGQPSDWNLSQWAEDLGDLINVLGIHEPILFGQSFGGFVALRYAIENSDQLGGLVLSSTAARHVPADCLAVFERLGGGAARDAAAAFFENPTDATFAPYQDQCMTLYNTTPQEPMIRRRQLLKPDVLYHFWRDEYRRLDLLPELHRITCPTLITVGDQDPITPLGRSLELADGLHHENTQCEVFADAGHGVYRDAPEPFTDVLRKFVASVRQARAAEARRS